VIASYLAMTGAKLLSVVIENGSRDGLLDTVPADTACTTSPDMAEFSQPLLVKLRLLRPIY